MTHRDVANGSKASTHPCGMGGYSLVEILIVVALVAVMTAISLPYLFNSARKFKTEDQAIKVMDLMKEASQLAMTRRRTIQFEIDRTNISSPVLRIIDLTNANFNKTIPLEPLSLVRMDTAPVGFTPPSPPNYPAAVYTTNVWRIWFTSGGSILNAPGGTPVSATLYSWRPIMEPGTPFNISNLTPARREEVRAVTVEGGRGAVRYWKYTGTGWAGSL
jgi:type II secretory pathway pseudopilin PulG